MAVPPPFESPLPGASFFDIYNDNAAPAVRSPVNLPGGGCNFVDLTPGANGAKCGCRRFWSRFAAGRAYADNLGSDHSTWCMCSHHACYHDGGDHQVADAPATAGLGSGPVTGQENEKPRGNREPLSPVIQDFPYHASPAYLASVDMANLEAAAVVPFSSPRKTEHCRPRLGNQAHESQQQCSTLQDTLPWGEFVQSQSANPALPPIPAQCLMPSQPSSTTSSSQARYLRPFAGRGLQTLSGVAPGSNVRAPAQGTAHATEPAPRSPRFPRISAREDPSADPPGHPSFAGSSTPRPSRTAPVTDQGPEPGIFGPPSRETFQHLSDTVQGHENRLDRLENVSFSTGGHDECHDKHDAADLRVTDLEVRMEEVEKMMSDTTTVGTARHVRQTGVDESNASVVSVSTNATTRAAGFSAVFSQVQSLQSQLVQFRSMAPTHSHPWEVEVVFLPFPLRRLWQEPHDFKHEPAPSLDGWTQLPNTISAATSRAQSPFCGDWVDVGQDHSWLLPKACGPSSIIDKRLRSRGLVRTISVKGADARSVQAAMHVAFDRTLSEMANAMPPSPRRRSIDSKTSKYLGLQQTWVPLRKIHKDSRLRFLSPSEMVTPALWDVPFLNSVIMKSSEQRLFVTHPEAYLQDLNAYDLGWTWQALRELSRVYPDNHSAQEVPEADALEEYWAFNEQLDEPASVQSSLSLRQARQRISLSPSQQYFAAKSSLRSPSPFISRGQTPMTEDQQSMTRPLRVRTTSMPPSAPTLISPSIAKRRVMSSGHQRKASTSAGRVTGRASTPSSLAAALAHKRRRTRSPSHSRNLRTPRYTASPSPVVAGFVVNEPNPMTTRGVTPLYYATPYSNAPLTETRSRGTGANEDDYGLYQNEDHDDGDEDIELGSPYAANDSQYDEDAYDLDMMNHFAPVQGYQSQQHRQVQPQDEPWPGIEEQDPISDGENVDPLFSPRGDADDDDDATSVASSQPSEYPSTQRGWQVPGADDGDFHIHEDEDRMP